MNKMLSKVLKLTRRALGTDSIRQQLYEVATELDQLKVSVHQQMYEMVTELDRLKAASQTNQQTLTLMYQRLWREGSALPGLDQVEFRAYSQNGEDGVLLFLFALIGTTNRKCVEMCAGDGIECNSANLIINHGWSGLLFDGDTALLERGKQFYARSKDTWIWPPRLVSAWITAENVNDLIRSNGFDGDIDLLSIDMDGMDWWIWRALDAIQPRVVVLEHQDCWEPTATVTVPYRPDFVAQFDEDGVPAYAGASLGAFVALGRKKGYRLVGCQRYGFNAFFLRNDVGQSIFPEVTAGDCLTHPKIAWGASKRLAKLKDLDWVDVRGEL